MTNRYELGGLLAEGAQGRLLHARDRISGKSCILKTGETIHQEALYALEWNHPYILRPFDCGIHPELGAYAAFPEVHAPSLLDWARNHPSAGEFGRVILQIAEFLSCLHHRGFLYNDFKPDHFLVLDSEIRVLDLGLCSAFGDQTSFTFSGTFPYISPERLAGRPYDQRSDIFAFGMMLLHLFFPTQDWNFAPDVVTLQKLQKNCEELEGEWKSLISEMTALEPNQRIENADDLWSRLLPASAKGTFLFFPGTDRPSFQFDFSNHKRIQIVTSASEITLEQVGRQMLHDAWKSRIPAFHFDLHRQQLSDCFVSLLHSLTGSPMSAFLPAIEKLRDLRTPERHLLIFQNIDSLSAAERTSFSYAISRLAQNSTFFILITSKKGRGVDLPEDIYKAAAIPSLSSEDLQTLLKQALPAADGNEARIARLGRAKILTADQLFERLREDLPAQATAYWPAAAKMLSVQKTLDSASTQEMRVLACLAIAGGSLSPEILEKSLPLKDTNQDAALEQLLTNGFVDQQEDVYHLSIQPKVVLSRLRKDRIRDIANHLLEVWPPDGDRTALYHVARQARKQRLAAGYALRIARNAERNQQLNLAMDYYWKAHSCGANLNRRRLFALLKFALRRAQSATAKKLLRRLRKRFGMSYRLSDLYLEFAHRTNDLAEGERFARSVIRRAARKNDAANRDYFTGRLAFFLQLQLKLDESRNLSQKLLSETSHERSKSLAHHNLGVVYFYKSKLNEAAAELRKAIEVRHTFRPNSYITLALVSMRKGNLPAASRWLSRAIHIFNRRQDTDRLCVALSNFGLIYKQAGQLKEARNYYQQSLHLSRLNRNQSMLCANLNNLAVAFELEGRTDRAIQLYEKSARAAKSAGMKGRYAIARGNAGLQYAFQNRFSKAIKSLTEAIEIYKQLNWGLELAEAHEFLGITYLLSGHFRRAETQFKMAERSSPEGGKEANLARRKLFRALLWIQTGLFQKARTVLDQTVRLQPETFEKGLDHYCRAFWMLSSPDVSLDGCREALHEAERIFRKLPSMFWLAKNYQLKAQYCLRTDHLEKAHVASTSAFNIFSRIGSRKEILKLTRENFTVNNAEDFVTRMADRLPYKILQMVKEVLSEREPEAIIAKTLAVALEFTDMERAALIIIEDPPRIFKSTAIDETAVHDIFEISKSAIEAAARSQKSYVSLDAGADPYLKGRPSIIAARIMSIVCLPLRAQNDTIAVLYLDSREGVETLGKTESILLEIFASVIALVLNKTLILEKSLAENKELRSSAGLASFPEIVGNSPLLTAVLKSVHQLLNVDIPVLITGETGTGKELIARVLHYCGARKNGSFIAVNCSALSKSLLESELFGHEKGAFTGADATKKGLFEQAKNGTLFLDEIGDMPHSMQAKLLRVLQEGEFRRVGGHETLRSDARVILATNRNLTELVKKDQFRYDLYYRIKAVQIHLPPLRDRVEDIPLLAAHFLKTSLLATRKKILGFTPEALEAFKRYRWPGNARQLKNEVDRVAAFTQKEWIEEPELDPEIRAGEQTIPRKTGTLKEREKQIILEALENNNWNILQTARALGLTRNGLYGKMKLHGVRKQVS